VHLALFPSLQVVEGWVEPDILERWDRLLQIRVEVNAGIEVERKEKRIGSSLGAHVELSATGGDYELLKQYEMQLPMFFIVSAVTLRNHGDPAAGLVIRVLAAPGVKCERCWRYVSTMSTDPAQPGICDRCQDALSEADAA
jgi:isoleucyl-tRNA synthetase